MRDHKGFDTGDVLSKEIRPVRPMIGSSFHVRDRGWARMPAYLLMIMMCASIVSASYASTVDAQTRTLNSSITHFYHLEDMTVAAVGDIIALETSTGVYKEALSASADTQTFFGIVVEEPMIYFRSSTTEDSVPIARSGVVPVTVSNVNGSIQRGDAITFSAQAGVGAKLRAEDSTPVIGIAQQDFPSAADAPVAEKIQIGQIMVDLDSTENAFMQSIQKLASVSDREFYLTIVRYVVAFAIAAGSVAIAYVNFTHTIRESVISIGRNPLAKDSIHRVIIYNSLLILGVLAIGFLTSFAVLRMPIAFL